MLFRLLRFLPSVIFVLAAVPYIDRPGVQYDEILFGNAALGGLDDSFIKKEIDGIPILLMPYIGALKAYLFYPIFHFFGVNVLSIRLPMILLTAISSQFFYSVLRKMEIKWAFGLTLLFVLHPSIVMFSRTDVGPSSIAIFLKLAILYLVADVYYKKNPRNLILISILSLIGVFNKLNFIWFSNALITSSCIILTIKIGHQFYKKEKIDSNKDTLLFFAILSYIPSLVYFIIIQKTYNISSSFDLTVFQETLIIKIKQLYYVLTGMSYPRYAIGIDISIWKRFIALFAMTTILGAGLCLLLLKEKLKTYRIPYLLMGLTAFFIVAQILYTKEATNPWHALSIEPFYTLSLGLSIWIIYKALESQISSKISTITSASLIFIFALHSTLGLFLNLRAIKENDGVAIWSTAIYDLIEYSDKERGTFFSGDWGTHTQLLTFNQDPDRFKNLIYVMTHGTQLKREAYFENEVLSPSESPAHFIFPQKENSNFPEIRKQIFELAQHNNMELVLSKEIADSKSTVRYQIFKLLEKPN